MGFFRNEPMPVGPQAVHMMLLPCFKSKLQKAQKQLCHSLAAASGKGPIEMADQCQNSGFQGATTILSSSECKSHWPRSR